MSEDIYLKVDSVRFIKHILKLMQLAEDKTLQKEKFQLLSDLLLELCHCKNSKDKFINILSLVLLLLNIYKKNYPLDLFTDKSTESKAKNNENFKESLKQEFLID
ncbi:MAG: hypothetical protein ACFFHD_06050 [Promethearchaeota archaeon]